MKIKKLCKFCDERVTSCAGKRTCKVDCEITSICPDAQDVCVTIWCVCPDCNTVPSPVSQWHRHFSTWTYLCWLGVEREEKGGKTFSPDCTKVAPARQTFHLPTSLSVSILPEQSDRIMRRREGRAKRPSAIKDVRCSRETDLRWC